MMSKIGTVCTAVCSIATLFFAFLTVSWVSLGHEWDSIVKSPEFPIKEWSVNHWENTIESIRIHESKEFVEGLMGQPQMSEIGQTKEIGLNEKHVVYYEKATYINEYFSLFCVYVDNSLVGYLVISNYASFRPENYRAGFSCLDDTVASAAKECDSLGMYEMCLAANCSSRTDNSSYYMECREQHYYNGSEYVLIGYGISDIGFCRNSKSIYELLSANDVYADLITSGMLAGNDIAAMAYRIEPQSLEVHEIFQNEVLSVRNEGVNAFFVFDDSDGFGLELLRESLMPRIYLGISRDRYANFVLDYPQGYRPLSTENDAS